MCSSWTSDKWALVDEKREEVKEWNMLPVEGDDGDGDGDDDGDGDGVCWGEVGRSHRVEHVACAELVWTGFNPEPGINPTQVTEAAPDSFSNVLFFINFDTEPPKTWRGMCSRANEGVNQISHEVALSQMISHDVAAKIVRVTQGLLMLGDQKSPK